MILNNSQNRKIIFEYLNKVLEDDFIDEIGELPKFLQSKLLRAVDSEILQGKRLNGKLDYSLKDLTASLRCL